MNLRKDELHVSVTTIILTSCKFVCIILEFLLRSLKTILVLIPLILYCLWVSSNRLIVVVFFSCLVNQFGTIFHLPIVVTLHF